MTKDGEKRYKELEAEYNALCVRKAELEGEIAKVLVEKARVELAPFAEGQLIKCEVPVGRVRKERVCRIEIDDGGKIWVRPVTENGKMSGRRFSVAIDEDKDYNRLFKEANR